jgi:hypothetical protein
MIAIASSQALISSCAISDTSVMACISPAILVADAASRIEKKQWELTALTTVRVASFREWAAAGWGMQSVLVSGSLLLLLSCENGKK